MSTSKMSTDYISQCIANDLKLVEQRTAEIKVVHETRLKLYRAWTNNPFDPAFTPEVVNSFWEPSDFPPLALSPFYAFHFYNTRIAHRA